jgi:SAM-dependent methyltransferase
VVTDPIQDQASAPYRGETGRRYQETKRAVPAEAYAWLAGVRARRWAERVGPEDTVFEYGVGLGWNLASLRCRRRLGYDVADSVAEIVRAQGIEFVEDPARMPAGEVDVAICHHTLEHVLEPAAVLRSLNRVLRPGGRLFVTVPWERERRYRRFQRGEPNHHLFTWNSQTLGNLVETCGFEVNRVRVVRYGYDRAAALLACRLRVGERGYRVLRGVLQRLKPLWEVEVEGQPR